MRIFTKSELIEFLKSKMSYSNDAANQMTNLIFKCKELKKKGRREVKK